jgi:serine/threonine-protein kinase
VWLADDLGLGIAVALKALHLADRAAAGGAALEALRNEARVLAGLHHPNIVRVLALRQSGGEHYLVLQYVAGGSLGARLEREGPLPWRQAARYIADVGDALVHVHGRGLVHRDIKAVNILWDADRDEALLTDFGLAGRLAGVGRAAGTPLFMAPEAFDGAATVAGDVYSLAATLFHLLTGEAPFPATSYRKLRRRINAGLLDPDPRCAGIPEPLERVLRAALAVAPEERPALPAFVAALRGTLNQLLADALLPAPGAPARPAPVNLRLVVARWEGGEEYRPVAATHPLPATTTRNLTKVPPAPGRVTLRTGDRVRVEVVADRDGFVTVFNVGPGGDLTLLYPDAAAAPAAPPLAAGRPLHILDVVLTPPAGRERLVAVWSRVPAALPLEELLRMTRGEAGPVSASYRATRNIERVRASVERLRPEDWHAAVLELDHAG